MLTYKTQVESTKLGRKAGLFTLKSRYVKSIEQRHLPAVSECDTQRHSLWAGSHNLVTVQPPEARQGATQSALPTGPATNGKVAHKMERVKAYLNAMQNPKNSLHNAAKEEKGCRQAKDNH